MRSTTVLLTAIALSTAAFAALPSAEASMKACTAATAADCAGFVCVDRDGNGAFSNAECVSKADLDVCQFQSDCCSTVSGFWCPENS